MAVRTVIVIAKEPRPGRVKTRLTPPCTPGQAATLARAALADTLRAVARLEVERRLLCLDGAPGPWLAPGFDVAAQRGDGLGARLAHAFGLVDGEPSLVVGMDTPQLDGPLLDTALSALRDERTDAVLGPADDGGYWAIGFRRPTAGAFDGVPMSSGHTFEAQLARLEELGLRTRLLPVLRDVDVIEDAVAVAATAPRTRFAAALRALEAEWRRAAA
jgi:uncharacterized protein